MFLKSLESGLSLPVIIIPPQVVHSWVVQTRCTLVQQLDLNTLNTLASSQRPPRTPSQRQPHRCPPHLPRVDGTKASATPPPLTPSPPLQDLLLQPGRTTVTAHLHRRAVSSNRVSALRTHIQGWDWSVLHGYGQRNSWIL